MTDGLTGKLRRLLLRKAEAVFDDPKAKDRLAEEGIHFGERHVLSPEERAALLEESDGPDEPSVTVVCYFADTPVKDRGVVEDPLTDHLEQSGLGTWLGSGQGNIGGKGDFFDVAFAVPDIDAAVPVIQAKLRELGAGPRTELCCSDGRTLGLGTAKE
jgi:hypothetical protein